MLRRWAARASQFNPLAVYALAYAAGAAVQKGLGFVLIFWLAQALTVDEYARFGLLFALQSGVAMLAGAGILDSVIGLLHQQHSAADRARLFQRANGVLLQLSILTLIIASAGYFFVADAGETSPTLLAAVLVGGAMLAYFTHQATLVRLDEHHRASLLIALSGPLAGFCGAFLAFVFIGTADSFFYGMATGMVASALVLRQVSVGSFGIEAGRAPTADIRSRLGPFVLIALLSWLGGYGNTYIVKLLFESSEIASFTFLFTLSSIMQLVATSTNQVWSPRFFKLVHDLDRDEMERRNSRFYLLQGAALGGTGASVLLVLPLALSTFGGNLSAYAGLETELFLLFAGYAVSVPWWHAQNYFLAFGEGPALMRAVFASSAAGLAIWVGLMILLGNIGIYLGFFVQMGLRSAWVMVMCARRWGLKLAWQGVAAALAMLIGALGIASFAGWPA